MANKRRQDGQQNLLTFDNKAKVQRRNDSVFINTVANNLTSPMPNLKKSSVKFGFDLGSVAQSAQKVDPTNSSHLGLKALTTQNSRKDLVPTLRFNQGQILKAELSG